jgi:hypothetical protein
MSINVFPDRYSTELNMPELELPMSYGMNCGWGTIQVTEGAHEAYGLTPLVPTVTDRSDLRATNDTTKSLVKVVLAAPHELPEPPQEGSIWTSHVQSKSDIGILVGLGMDLPRAKELKKASLFEQFQPLLGEDLTIDEVLGRMVTPDNVPIIDTIEAQTKSLIAHQLSNSVSDETSIALAARERHYDNMSIKQRLQILGGVGITSTFAPLFVVTALEVPLQPASLAFPAATALTTAVLSSRSLGRWLRQQPTREAAFSNHADYAGQLVGDNFHDAYCTNHFDNQFTQMLPQD